MRGVDHDHIDFGVDQRFAALEALVPHGGRGSDAQAAGRVLRGVGVIDRLLDVLDRDQADAMLGLVDHDQLLDPALVEQAARLFLSHAFAHCGEVFARHQFVHRLARIVGEAAIAIGQDAVQLAELVDHRDAADLVLCHQRLRIAQRGIGQDRDRVDHHAAFIAFHRAHGGGLFLDRQIAVEHADPAQLRHHDRHVGLGHRVHCAGDDRDVQRDFARQARARIGLARQDRAFRRTQQHIVESQSKQYFNGHAMVP